MKRGNFEAQAALASELGARFSLGEVIVADSVLKRLRGLGVQLSDLIGRHRAGDWGEIDDQERAMNDENSGDERRLFSAYEIENERFWVLTTADRSRTIVFLPGDAPAALAYEE